MADKIFEHICVHEGCITVVQYDDAPWCGEHIPEGQDEHLAGYSARRAYNQKLHLEDQADVIDTERGTRNNIFERD